MQDVPLQFQIYQMYLRCSYARVYKLETWNQVRRPLAYYSYLLIPGNSIDEPRDRMSMETRVTNSTAVQGHPGTQLGSSYRVFNIPLDDALGLKSAMSQVSPSYGMHTCAFQLLVATGQSYVCHQYYCGRPTHKIFELLRRAGGRRLPEARDNALCAYVPTTWRACCILVRGRRNHGKRFKGS
jgi:hypothetical protein